MSRRNRDLTRVFHSRLWSRRAGGPALTDHECRLPPDFVVLHDVDVARTGEPLEHLVIGPTGIFTVRTYLTTSFIELVTGRRWRDGHPVVEQCERSAWEAIVTSDALDAVVIPVLCLLGTMNNSGLSRAGNTIISGRAMVSMAICDRPSIFDRTHIADFVQASRQHALQR